MYLYPHTNWEPPLKEGPHKMGPYFYEKQKIELFRQNLTKLIPHWSHFSKLLFASM
jgi:hypothetical protein